MKKYGFGVDIGGTTIKMSLFEMTGHMVDKWEIPTNTQNNGSSILSDVAAVIEGRLVQDGISKEDVEGIGIGVPGPVVQDSVVTVCVNLGWGRVDVAKELAEKTGLKVRVGNDANVAALGEMWQGGGKGYKNVIMITLGTGVGGGIIINGHVINGSNGAGGEIGHVFVDETEEETCGCGKRGCLEQYASATGIVRMAKRALAADNRESTLRSVEDLSAKAVLDAAKAGDEMALEVVEQMGKRLGTVLAQAACIVDPEVFVIGGGVSKAGTIITEVIRKYYIERAFNSCRNADFALAELGNDAGVYGCVYLLLSSN
ncbi:Glucokinase [Eubacterium plexicaudatum ASF492]|uniref:Glucokinase n=1 Tax=Eubacterium plexicaudatum ASF492 TaxID=1235802 RepID=N2BGB8_9FIRM|nr:Glucokinase [Eubacterium plexicaudatum ASF492]